MAKETGETEKYKVAAASTDGIVVNQHFGRADLFYIYEATEQGYSFLEKRNVTPVCHGGNHDDKELQRNVHALEDCKYILVSRIGMGAANLLEQSGITPMELPGMIEESLRKLNSYIEVQNLF